MNRAKEANPFGFIIKPIDIKELKASIELALLRYKMDEKLIENEEKYFNILASIGDAVIVTGDDGNITYINPVAEKMTGFKLSDVAGQSAHNLINIENVEVKQPAITNDDDSDIINRSYLISKDNSKTPVDYRSSPQKDRNGDYIGTVVVLRDITRSVKSEDKLHESFKMLRKAMGGAIQAMAQTVESRDPYTAGHQKRVSNIARMIADELSLKRDQIEGIRLAGVIHDLGKISIPAEILSKPGRITEVEFNLIKNHPETGYDILKTIDFPWPIAEIVHQHHERIDGSGYPRGLSGDEIMIEAKILAVADVVEAMASHRPYRPSLGIDVALEEIEKNRNKLYDKEVADICIDIFRKKKIDIEAIR
jgi:PAS domain S-box-containing protein/putative nucleotidyltransferase with HDIG domain